jgi:hypothetical protein
MSYEILHIFDKIYKTNLWKKTENIVEMGEMSDISDNVAIERMEDIYRKNENKYNIRTFLPPTNSLKRRELFN